MGENRNETAEAAQVDSWHHACVVLLKDDLARVFPDGSHLVSHAMMEHSLIMVVAIPHKFRTRHELHTAQRTWHWLCSCGADGGLRNDGKDDLPMRETFEEHVIKGN